MTCNHQDFLSEGRHRFYLSPGKSGDCVKSSARIAPTAHMSVKRSSCQVILLLEYYSMIRMVEAHDLFIAAAINMNAVSKKINS